MITEDPQLETRLRRYGSVLRNEVQVSPAVHAQILDRVDRRAPVRSHRFVAQLAAAAAIIVVAVGAMGVVLKLRANELAKAAPHVTSLFPADGATGVPLKGEFRVTFASRPSASPTLRAEPADAALQPVEWTGPTMVVKYAGLRPSARYVLVLSANYTSRQGDRGHFEERWGFTAEGPAQVTGTTPAAGETGVARIGQLTIRFAHRPVVDPVIQIEPADGSLQAGQWTDATWAVNYSGLQTLRSYRVLMDLDFGNPAANFHREWTFTAEPGAPPSNVPLIWFATSDPWAGTTQEPHPQHRLVAIDWKGALVGTLYQSGPGYQAPDGSRLYFAGVGYTETTGKVLAGASSLKGGPAFADDSRRTCQLLDASGGNPGALQGNPTWLFTGSIGSQLRRVAQAGQVGGQSGPGVAACSISSDRAVVTEGVIAWVSEVWVFRLTTGALLYHHVYSSHPSSVVASHDGRYLAEDMTSTDAQGGASGETLIRRTSDGAAVAHLAGRTVVAFSWDGARVVTTGPWGSSGANEVQLIDWQRGKVVWRSAAPTNATVNVIAQPNGALMAIGVGTQGASGVPQVDSLWIVEADGSAKQVATGPLFTAF